jgi:exo-beta-1,3-glucanase (GH17 family)
MEIKNHSQNLSITTKYLCFGKKELQDTYISWKDEYKVLRTSDLVSKASHLYFQSQTHMDYSRIKLKLNTVMSPKDS